MAKRSAQVKEERPQGAGDTEQNVLPYMIRMRSKLPVFQVLLLPR